MPHLICPAREERIDALTREAYRLDGSGQLEAFTPYPDRRVEPALTLHAADGQRPADGRHKWAANCSHLMYDVLSDFLFHRAVLGGSQVLMKPTRLGRELVSLLGGRIIDPDSDEGRAWPDDQLATVDNRWRFFGGQHSAITRQWRQELLGKTPEPTGRTHLLITRRVRYANWTYNRNVADVQAVRDELARQGLNCQIVYLEDLPLAEQIGLFRSADVVISAHGSGLVWLSLCKPGTVCVELLTPYFTKAGQPKADFWHIGRHSRIRYVPFYCDTVKGDAESAYDNDAVVSAELLMRLVEIGLRRPVPEPG